MTINSRIKLVRKEAGLNQKEFSEIIGVTQSGVSYMEQDGRNVSDLTVKSICNRFNVNEEWLVSGNGSAYIEPDFFSLDDFARKNNATALEIEIIKIYFELDQGIRRQIVSHFRERLASFDDVPATPAELEEKFPPVSNSDNNSEAG